MGIVYLFSLLILALMLILFKKTDKKLNIIIVIIYSFGIVYFLESLEALILSFLNIKNTLFSFSISNLLISIGLFLFNKNKYDNFMIQKYYLKRKELICFFILIVVCFTIGIIRFAGFDSINYNISDSVTHYKMSTDYIKYMKLFDSGYKDAAFSSFSHCMFGYYVPCGLFMKMMPVPYYVSYNIFNTCFLCLLAVSFYALCLIILKNDKVIFPMILVFLYVFGYPLNYFLYGFGYLGSGILAVNMILLTWKIIEKHNKGYLPLTLFNFGLFISYYLFVPVVYFSEFIFMIYNGVKNKYKLFRLLKNGIFCLLIPFIFGLFYFILRSGISNTFSVYSIDGESYENLFGNFILLLPLVIYSVISQAKKGIFDFNLSLLICICIYILITFEFIGSANISPYYFYKPYYILWMIVYIFIVKLVDYEEYINVLKINYFIIILAIILSIINVEEMVSNKNNNFSNSGLMKELGSVYSSNYNLFNNKALISPSEISLMKKSSKHSECIIDGKLLLAARNYKKGWFYVITGILPNTGKYLYEDTDYNSFISGESTCILYFNEYLKEDHSNECVISLDGLKNKDYNSFDDEKCVHINNYLKDEINNFEVVYKNEKGSLVRKK